MSSVDLHFEGKGGIGGRLKNFLDLRGMPPVSTIASCSSLIGNYSLRLTIYGRHTINVRSSDPGIADHF